MLPIQVKAKGVHHHQAIFIGNVKGTYLRKRSKLYINTHMCVCMLNVHTLKLTCISIHLAETIHCAKNTKL